MAACGVRLACALALACSIIEVGRALECPSRCACSLSLRPCTRAPLTPVRLRLRQLRVCRDRAARERARQHQHLQPDGPDQPHRAAAELHQRRGRAQPGEGVRMGRGLPRAEPPIALSPMLEASRGRVERAPPHTNRTSRPAAARNRPSHSHRTLSHGCRRACSTSRCPRTRRSRRRCTTSWASSLCHSTSTTRTRRWTWRTCSRWVGCWCACHWAEAHTAMGRGVLECGWLRVEPLELQ